MLRTDSRAARLGAALLSGVAISAAQTIGPLWPAGVAAFVPLLWASSAAGSTREAFVISAAAGVLQGASIVEPLVSASDWTGWVAAPSVSLFPPTVWLRGLQILLAVSCGGLPWGLIGAWVHWLGVRGERLSPLSVASAWVLLEFVRVMCFGRYQWGIIGCLLAEVPVVRELAAVGGVWLLSVVLLAVNVVWLQICTGDLSFRQLVALGVMAGAVTSGAVLGLRSQVRDTGAVLVRVAHNAGAGLRLEDLDRRLSGMTQTSGDADACGTSGSLVVMPEATLGYTVALDEAGTAVPGAGDGSQATALIGYITARLPPHTGVLLGVDIARRAERFNSMMLVSAQGLEGIYHKQALVPFAESAPRYGNLLRLRGSVPYAAGHSAEPLNLADGRVGVVICSEIEQSDLVRRSAESGAEMLAAAANDNVFASQTVGLMHHRLTLVRAIEVGRFIARATNGGVSSIVNERGEAVAVAHLPRPDWLVGCARLHTHVTPYSLLGDWVPVFAAAWVAGISLRRWSPRS